MHRAGMSDAFGVSIPSMAERFNAGLWLLPHIICHRSSTIGSEKRLASETARWDYTIMKLVADENGRLACKGLFTPRKVFSAERQADGSIRLVELVEKEVPVVRARKVNGRWMGAAVKLDRAAVLRAIRADREAR
jgi:hypothetical protein